MKKRTISFLTCSVIIMTYIFSMLPVMKIKAAATEYEQSLLDAGFPQSYVDKLSELHDLHPTWNFEPVLVTQMKPQYTWDYVISKEIEDPENNLIYYSYSANDYAVDSNLVESGLWYKCSRDTLEFFMDPRNNLTERNIFQFETLEFSDKYDVNDVQSCLEGTFMANGVLENGKTYAQHIYDVGKSVGISPLHLASRLKQEQGLYGTSPLISGSCGDKLAQIYAAKTDGAPSSGYDGYNFSQYNGLYNYFNMGASGTGYFEIWLNGMKEAQSEGWTTRYKAIEGGAQKVYNKYISVYQYTLYFQKFNVHPSSNKNFWGQYMQNVSAPWSEGRMIQETYAKNGLLDLPFTFSIPVYDGMEAEYPNPGSSFKDNISYANCIDIPEGSRVNNKPVKKALSCSKDTQSIVSIAGWSVHSSKAKAFEISIDGGAWTKISSSFRQDVYNATTNISQSAVNNSFATDVNISSLPVGERHVAIRGKTENNMYYLIYCLKLTVTSLYEGVIPDHFSTVFAAFDGGQGSYDKGFAYDFGLHAANENLLVNGNSFRNRFTPRVGTSESGINVTDGIAAEFSGFAQCYSDNRWHCTNSISFDLKMVTSGSNFCGFLVKYGHEIPSGMDRDVVFFENDKIRGDSQNSTTGASGIGFSFRTINGVSGIEIFVKYLDNDGKMCVEGQFFPSPVNDIKAFNTYMVTDDNNGTIKFYANNNLFATVQCSNVLVPTANTSYKESYYNNAKILDKRGNVLSEVTNALVSQQSALAFGTRAETMEVDNINIIDWDGTAPTPNVEGELKINGVQLTLESDISIRYLVYKDTFDEMGFVKPYLKVVDGEAEITIDKYVVETTSNGREAYIFEFKNISPQKMNDVYTAQLFAENNNVLFESKKVDYSVAKYVYGQLANTTDNNFKRLLVDMLKYGAAAQQYTSYKTDALVDASLTAEQAAYGTTEARDYVSVNGISSSGANVSATWKSMALYLKNKVEIKASFDAENIEGLHVKVYDENNYLVDTIYEDSFFEGTLSSEKKVTSFCFDGLSAAQLSKTFRFVVCDSNGNFISDYLSFSVESYANTIVSQGGADSSLTTLVKAIMNYGDAAKAYIGA